MTIDEKHELKAVVLMFEGLSQSFADESASCDVEMLAFSLKHAATAYKSAATVLRQTLERMEENEQ